MPKSELSNEKKSVIIIENSYKQITDMWKEKDVVGLQCSMMKQQDGWPYATVF